MPTRQQIYRRRRIVVGTGLLAVLTVAVYLPVTLLAPVGELEPAALPYSVDTGAAPEVGYPAFGASGFGAVGYDGVLGSAGAATPVPIASISKVITALVVLDARPIAEGTDGESLTFDEQDQQYFLDQIPVDGSRADVTVGETLSERVVIEKVLVVSSNNHSLSLARWAFGSLEGFTQAAAEWLAAHGLSGTTIVEPTGLSPGNMSTVPDLIEIGKLALEDPVVSQIVATDVITLPESGPVANSNKLLGVGGVDGIKTGNTDEAGSCLLFSADRQIGSQTVTIVGVVLGGPDHDATEAAVQQLLDQAYAGFREIEVIAAGTELATYATPWGDAAVAVAAESASTLVWADTVVTVTVDAASIHLADDGSAAGEVDVVAGERTFSVPLVLRGTIDDPGPWWRLTHPADLF
jgi:D-alanyl-D-alanine carboxypeptidase (penicillin-binding protein 5/6)